MINLEHIAQLARTIPFTHNEQLMKFLTREIVIRLEPDEKNFNTIFKYVFECFEIYKTQLLNDLK